MRNAPRPCVPARRNRFVSVVLMSICQIATFGMSSPSGDQFDPPS